MKKIETSKLILVVDFTIAIALTATVVVGELTGHDMTNTAIVAGVWDAQLGAACAFYYHKAKCENRAKGAQGLVKELADRYGIEPVAQIAEIIFRD